MEQPSQEPSGDYGYDLAHEDDDRRGAPLTPSEPPAPPAVPAVEPEGDYGYDEAHDF